MGVLIRDPRPADAEGLAQAASDLAQQYATVEPDRFSARAQGAELLATDTNLRSNLGAVEFYEHHSFERQSVVLRKRLS